MTTEEKIAFALQRKKELDLLIQHWRKQDDKKTATATNPKKSNG